MSMSHRDQMRKLQSTPEGRAQLKIEEWQTRIRRGRGKVETDENAMTLLLKKATEVAVLQIKGLSIVAVRDEHFDFAMRFVDQWTAECDRKEFKAVLDNNAREELAASLSFLFAGCDANAIQVYLSDGPVTPIY